MKRKIQLIKIWDAVKTVLKGKFISLNVHVTKEARFKTNNSSFPSWELDKEKQIKPKSNKKKKKREYECEDKSIKLCSRLAPQKFRL